jgi:predicted metal-dependent hydrolase
VSAYRQDGRTIVLIPAGFSKAEEQQWVTTMLDRLARGDRRRRPSDAQLAARAADLSARYLGGLAKPSSIRWVDNQQSRWGSCTPTDGTIRISDRVKGMPGYVLDYVVLHELAHLLVPAHGRQFWSLLRVYPRTERARGYLEGVAAAAGLEVGGMDFGDEDVSADGEAALDVTPED